MIDWDTIVEITVLCLMFVFLACGAIVLILGLIYFIDGGESNCNKQVIGCFNYQYICTKGCIMYAVPVDCDLKHSYEKEVCLHD